MCNVSVVDRLIVSPEISWTKYVSSADYALPDDDISVDAVRIGNELSLDFIRLNTSDAGRYTCEAVLTIPQITVARSTTNQDDITLQSKYFSKKIIHYNYFSPPSPYSRSYCNSLSS